MTEAGLRGRMTTLMEQLHRPGSGMFRGAGGVMLLGPEDFKALVRQELPGNGEMGLTAVDYHFYGQSFSVRPCVEVPEGSIGLIWQ